MILINLLPHREAARKRRREAFYGTLGAAECLIAVIQHFLVAKHLHAGGERAHFEERHDRIHALARQLLDQAGGCQARCISCLLYTSDAADE